MILWRVEHYQVPYSKKKINLSISQFRQSCNIEKLDTLVSCTKGTNLKRFEQKAILLVRTTDATESRKSMSHIGSSRHALGSANSTEKHDMDQSMLSSLGSLLEPHQVLEHFEENSSIDPGNRPAQSAQFTRRTDQAHTTQTTSHRNLNDRSISSRTCPHCKKTFANSGSIPKHVTVCRFTFHLAFYKIDHEKWVSNSGWSI